MSSAPSLRRSSIRIRIGKTSRISSASLGVTPAVFLECRSLAAALASEGIRRPELRRDCGRCRWRSRSWLGPSSVGGSFVILGAPFGHERVGGELEVFPQRAELGQMAGDRAEEAEREAHVDITA